MSLPEEFGELRPFYTKLRSGAWQSVLYKALWEEGAEPIFTAPVPSVTRDVGLEKPMPFYVRAEYAKIWEHIVSTVESKNTVGGLVVYGQPGTGACRTTSGDMSI